MRGPLSIQDAGDIIRMIHGSPIGAISKSLRGFLIPDDGYEFIVADFAAIEARVLAWLAGEDSVLDIFRGDGKLYERMAAEMFGVEVAKVTKAQRQQAKVACLACGYQGSVGAFQALAANYGVKLSDDEVKRIVELWRAANPNIRALWKELERAAIAAVKSPETIVEAAGGKIKFRKKGSHLLCRLPSGRVLTYPFAVVRPKTVKLPDREPWVTEELRFWSLELGQKWMEIGTYGGSLTENVVQAISRDLLVEAMLRLEAAQYPIALHVHDEVVVEVRKGSESFNELLLCEVTEIMSMVPAWAEGLPLGVEAWRGGRYGK